MQKICPQHNGSFETKYPDQVYCSRLCKDRARRLRGGVKPLARRSWMPGQRFGRLVLVERKSNGSRQLWFCDCDCGTKGFLARSDKLKEGRQQSCGCLRRENNQRHLDQRLKQKEESDSIRLINSVLTRTKQEEHRKIEATKWAADKHKILKRYLALVSVPLTDLLWNLGYYAELIKDGCIYCRGSLGYKGTSLGEINPTLPFSASNVAPECQFCEDRNLWNDVLSFDERVLLGQTMELIRLKRIQNNFPLFVSKNDL